MRKLRLKEVVVKITIVCHGNEDDGGAAFSPGDQVGIVFKNRAENYWVFTVLRVLLSVAFEVEFVNV